MTACTDSLKWYVMRDLKRPNAKVPAYKALMADGFDVFTPMRWLITTVRGKRERKQVPFMQDLLFVHSKMEEIEPVVNKTPTLQFRFVKGRAYREPLTVDEQDMNRFIHAVKASEDPCYFSPDEIDSSMYGKKVRIIGGALDSYEGYLLKVRGSRKKKLIIELPSVLTMTVEVEPEFIQFL